MTTASFQLNLSFSLPTFAFSHNLSRLRTSGDPISSRSHFKSKALPHDTGGVGIELLEEFIQLNVGSWSGSFTQYDAQGNTLHHIPTRVAANSYGRGQQVSLYQTLSIKPAPSKTFIADEEPAEDDWAEFKLGETNLLTIGNRQQVGCFPNKGAYTISRQTAEMLDKVMRAGILGEDDDDSEEVPEGIKLPSRRPALVCESCLYSEDGENRLRAFHILDSRGLLDFIGVFQERKDSGSSTMSSGGTVQDMACNRLDALLGCWSGHSVTRRTEIYGSTVVEEDIKVTFKLEDDGTVVQDIESSRGNLHFKGTSYGSLVRFDKGLQMILLPGGMAMVSPANVGQSVGRSQSFYFEFAWIYSPGRRRRLVRTYDTDGIVVSTTFVDETKVY